MNFDRQVVCQDPDAAQLAEQFVCVRIQSMNGVNINLFQFERDLTWMAFFMDAQDRFYARYGGREDDHPESHLNKDSLLAVMRQVLELHKAGKVQTSRYEPTPPVSPPPRGGDTGGVARTPEDIATMKALMAPRKDSKCIHCHDVKVAELRHLQAQGRFSRDLVFTYPAPSAVGIRLDPKAQSKLEGVTAGSPAEKAGVRAGDVLLSADGQRVLTLADLARVLEQTPKESKLPLELRRGEQTVRVTLELAGDWRRSTDPSWRESLHVAGPNAGFWGMKLKEEERRKLGLPAGGMAVKVTYIWADYTRRAGVKEGDVVVELDGIRRDLTIPQVHAHLNLHRDYGDSVPLVVYRDGKEHKLTLQLPKEAPKLE